MRPADLPLKHRLLLGVYQWRRAEHVPPAVLSRPIAQARIALVTSAGLVAPGDVPFDLSIRGGDWSYRVIPGDADLRTLTMHHRSDAFDPGPLEADRNVAFPLDRLRALAARGVVGSVAPRHLSFMGSITAPARLRAQAAPDAAERLAEDSVDVALLVPV